jgi:gluconate 2-dehydrogenase
LKPKVLIARPIPAEVEAYIRQHCDARIAAAPLLRAELLEQLADVEGLLTSGHYIDDELLDRAPKLKVVCNSAVGYNNFDIDAMRRRNVMGTNTPYVLDDTVADLILGLMLAAARRIPELDQYVREGRWQKGSDEELFGVDVHHAKLGIIGLGRIGMAIAKRARLGFDMEIVYYNRRRHEEAERLYDAQWLPLDDLLQQSDFVVLMTPLTPSTVKLLGKREFGLMKPNAIFINGSRGQTIDEQALVEALQQGKIRAAGLDVFEREPVPADHPLLKLKQTVLLPHIGSATAKTRAAMAMAAAKNLVKAVTGEIPPNLVDELKDLRGDRTS